MARPLSVASGGKYTDAQVKAVMIRGGGVARGRFELYDFAMNYIGPLEGVTAATVSFDRSRSIPSLLKITMAPTSVPFVRPAWDHTFLRDKPFQFYVKVWAQFGPMPDGGLAEFPMGVYIWQRPQRHILGTSAPPWPGSEMWDVDLPDLTHWLDADGPGDDAFILWEGTPVGLCIQQTLDRVGITDYSGVTWSPLPLPTTMTYFFWKTFSSIFTPNQTEGTPETWLDILGGCARITAFSAPWFDLDGVYQARVSPMLDLGAPDVVYDTAEPGVTLLPIESEPDNALLCNRIFAVSDSGGGEQLKAVIDLNDWLPTHPLAQRTIRHYISIPFSVPGAPTYEALYVSGLLELARRLTMYEKYTLTTVGFLKLHEADELVAVRVRNDPELSSNAPMTFAGQPVPPDAAALTPPDWQYHAFLELGWEYDVFTAKMTHTLGRMWRTF